MNAVADAADTQEIEMPATPQRVWRALRETRRSTTFGPMG